MNLKSALRASVFLAATLVIQYLHMPQLFTGTLVNAILFLTLIFAGLPAGIAVGCMTPLLAFLTGILPAPLAPVIPVIMLANLSLILGVKLLKDRNVYLAAVTASVIKFCVFFICLKYVVGLFGIMLPKAVFIAFGVPQLYTALAGTLIAAFLTGRLRSFE